MTTTTLTSREFNQDTSGAEKAANAGPVFITDRGRPAHVLLTAEDYQALAGPPPTQVWPARSVRETSWPLRASRWPRGSTAWKASSSKWTRSWWRELTSGSAG